MSSTVLTLPSWKQEPLSPPTSEDTWASSPDDSLFYSTLEHNDFKLETDLFSSCNNGESKADLASQLLEGLENLVDLDELIKEEPFFLDVKMLPILDDMDQSRYPVKVEQYKPVQLVVDEFDASAVQIADGDVLDYAATPTTLTPPQSPPREPILTTLKPLVAVSASPFQQAFQNHQIVSTEILVPEHVVGDVKQHQQLLENVLVYHQQPDVEVVVDYPAAVMTPQPDIAHELAVVDELVRSHVENMQWTSSTTARTSYPSSPCSNSNSASNSSFEDSSSSSDPEWMPEAVDSLNRKLEDGNAPASRAKRSKPYSRSVEDKKSRKKEQNKNAATRYRMKKKAEVEEILTEEKQLMMVGEKFSGQITDLQREIKYLKGLMRELFKAKGLIN